MGTHLPQKGHSIPPQFLANVCCGQTAWWMKMPLCTAVNLGPGDIVLDGDPAFRRRNKWTQQPPTFWPMSIVAKRSPTWATAELLFVFRPTLCYFFGGGVLYVSWHCLVIVILCCQYQCSQLPGKTVLKWLIICWDGHQTTDHSLTPDVSMYVNVCKFTQRTGLIFVMTVNVLLYSSSVLLMHAQYLFINCT